MKKTLSVFLTIIIIFLLTSCFYEQDGASTPDTTAEQTTDGTTTAVDTTTAVADTTTRLVDTTTADIPTGNKPSDESTRLNYTDVKAMWISQFDLNDVYGGETQRDEAEFRAMVGNMMENIAGIGINTVIVQARPNGDSMYPSELYAPSVYVVGAYGREFSYDPFGIIVEEAHKRELSIHAWINPMRGMTEDQIEMISSKYQLKKWWSDATLKERYLPVVSSRVYLNVGEPSVRQLIVDGARELLEKYKVDGLHMDDYFYPTQDASFDATSYAELGGTLPLEDWRRESLNALVCELYSTVKSVDDDILFGISPAGTMERDYEEFYADVYEWCSRVGYVDYICPQIYFGFDHQTQPFDMNVDKWNSIVTADGVRLWIGMTLGKALDGSLGVEDQYAGTQAGKTEWINNRDVLRRCLEKTLSAEKCTGAAYFCYQYFWDPMSGAEIEGTKTERENLLPYLATVKWS